MTGKPKDVEYTWVGIGGWSKSATNIIQIGTFGWLPPGWGGLASHGIWYETVPGGPPQHPLLGISPGDRIYASVTEIAPGQWQVALTDVSRDLLAFSRVLHFKSLGSDPSVVVEDPDALGVKPADGGIGPFAPFPRWGSVAFTNVQVCVGSKWVAAAALPAVRVDMIRSGIPLATAGKLTRQSSFSATQGAQQPQAQGSVAADPGCISAEAAAARTNNTLSADVAAINRDQSNPSAVQADLQKFLTDLQSLQRQLSSAHAQAQRQRVKTVIASLIGDISTLRSALRAILNGNSSQASQMTTISNKLQRDGNALNSTCSTL